MAQNPLQQYFRQPKIFIDLPSQGIYSKPGTFNGDVNRMPIYGMTGMDEILIKTPDALLSGESTVAVVNSCCPVISDAWGVSTLDMDAILVAIRIATFGNSLPVVHVCPNCDATNEYDIDLNRFVDHFSKLNYENKLVLKDFTIGFRPLSYKESTEFGLQNFTLQQELKQIAEIKDDVERQHMTNEVFKKLAVLKNAIFAASIEYVDTGNQKVEEKQYIREWIDNSDSSVMNEISKHLQKIQETWSLPKTHVKCNECQHDSDVSVDMDYASFFASA